jgi:hypothetical protein
MIAGNHSDRTINTGIVQESTKYGDIIQEDFVDDYRNMTYKGICGFRWVTTFCVQYNVQYILKTDDDVLVDMVALLNLLRPHSRSIAWTAPKHDLLMCRVYGHVKVHRKGKWAVSWLLIVLVFQTNCT